MCIDYPFILPKCANLITGSRDLSSLDVEISSHVVPFFGPEIRETPEFEEARRAYEMNHRFIDSKHAFLDIEHSLLHETRVQYEMRQTGTARSLTAEAWLVWTESHNTQIMEYTAQLDKETHRR